MALMISQRADRLHWCPDMDLLHCLLPLWFVSALYTSKYICTYVHRIIQWGKSPTPWTPPVSITLVPFTVVINIYESQSTKQYQNTYLTMLLNCSCIQVANILFYLLLLHHSRKLFLSFIVMAELFYLANGRTILAKPKRAKTMQ